MLEGGPLCPGILLLHWLVVELLWQLVGRGLVVVELGVKATALHCVCLLACVGT